MPIKKLKKVFSRKWRAHRKKVTSKSRVSKSTKRYVKSQIHKSLENKTISQIFSGTTSLGLSSSSTPAVIYDLTPTINQGTAMGQRVGSKIRIKSAKLEWNAILSGAAITANIDVPVNIYFAICRPRQNQASFSTTEYNNMFISAGAFTGFYSSDPYASQYIPNTNYFEYKYFSRKPIKLGYENYGAGTASLTNNDYSIQRRGSFDMTRVYTKTCNFNNNTSTATNNSWYLVVMVQKYNYDNTAVNWDPPQFYLTLNTFFEDA